MPSTKKVEIDLPEVVIRSASEVRSLRGLRRAFDASSFDPAENQMPSSRVAASAEKKTHSRSR
jgi:hypothetical protein